MCAMTKKNTTVIGLFVRAGRARDLLYCIHTYTRTQWYPTARRMRGGRGTTRADVRLWVSDGGLVLVVSLMPKQSGARQVQFSARRRRASLSLSVKSFRAVPAHRRRFACVMLRFSLRWSCMVELHIALRLRLWSVFQYQHRPASI